MFNFWWECDSDGVLWNDARYCHRPDRRRDSYSIPCYTENESPSNFAGWEDGDRSRTTARTQYASTQNSGTIASRRGRTNGQRRGNGRSSQNDTRYRPYWDRNQSNFANYRNREATDDDRNANEIRADVNRNPRVSNNRRKQHNRAAAAGNNTPANSIPGQKTQGKKRGQTHNSAPNNAVVQDGSIPLPTGEKRNRRRRNRTKNRSDTANDSGSERVVQHSASTAVFNYDNTPSMAVVDDDNTPPMFICSICEEPCEMNAIWRPFLCDHSGHVGCMEAYLQTNDRCPVCRECEEVQTSIASLVPLLSSSSPSDECPVCLQSCNFNETWQPFACGHSGHIACMEVSVRASGSCPVCSDTNEVSPLAGPTAGNPLHPSAEEQNEDICPICLDPCTPEDISHLFPCAHPGHRSCLREALRLSNKCPLCRMPASI